MSVLLFSDDCFFAIRNMKRTVIGREMRYIWADDYWNDGLICLFDMVSKFVLLGRKRVLINLYSNFVYEFSRFDGFNGLWREVQVIIPMIKGIYEGLALMSSRLKW